MSNNDLNLRTSGDGARAYISFLNNSIIEIQKLFCVELSTDEQTELRYALNDAIAKVIKE